MAKASTSGKAKAPPKEIDTTGMTPEQIAALAESTVKKRKPRNNVSAKTQKQKVSKDAGKHPPIVKSDEQTTEKPTGRPSTRSEAVIEKIIDRLSNGEPLRQICRDESMPPWRTVYGWMDADKELAARIARARDVGEDALAQECLDIADNAANDWMERFDNEGNAVGWQLNGDHVQRSKLRIETRLKLLAKWNPKKYGDKVDVNHGGQKGNPVEVQTRVVLVPPKQTAKVETKPLKREAE